MTNKALTYSALTSTGWVDEPTDFAPVLDGDIRCDVAVIGGGYTGMAAALRLAERGADVAVLESGFCGCGASSRNAGQMTNGLAGDPGLLHLLYRRRLPALVRYAESAAHFTEGLIKDLGTDCDYEPTGNVLAAVSTGQLRRLRKGAQIMRDAGGEAEFVDGRDFGLPQAFPGGMFESGGGVLNPGKFALGLRSALLGSDARVFERTTVQAVNPESSGVLVSTPSGRVRADRVLLATNAYSRDLAITPKRMVTPLWTSLVETEPIAPKRLAELGWHSRAGIATASTILENYRLTRRGTIVFGTRQLRTAPRRPLGPRTPPPAVVSDMIRGFRERFPSLRDVAAQQAWGGWIAMTTSLLPIAGEATKNVFYAIGCNGHGLAQTPYLGTLLADRLAGDPLHDDLRAVWRSRPRFAPAPAFSAPALRALWVTDRMADGLNRRKD